MTIETIKIMLDALENHTAIKHPQQAYYRDRALEAGRQAIAEAEKQSATHGEPVELAAILRNATIRSGKVIHPHTKPLRVAFEHYWIKTRSKKARNDLQRHPKQPETYVSDSANRHWVTWQFAQPKRDPLTENEIRLIAQESKKYAEHVTPQGLEWFDAFVQHFAQQVSEIISAKEREACAKIEEKLACSPAMFPTMGEYRTYRDAVLSYQKAIRARGEA